MKNNWSKPKRKEGEYPFLPKPPEHEVINPVGFLEVIDPETHQVKYVIDYGPGLGDNISLLF